MMQSPKHTEDAKDVVHKKNSPLSEGVSRDELDPSDDSGLSSISEFSASANSVVKTEDTTGTIGEGIAIVDSSRLEEEKRLVAERAAAKKREVKEETAAEKRLAQEKYEKEIQEKQYKCLMHLLSQSKALSSFILKKVDEDTKKKTPKAAPKRPANIKSDEPPPSKRGRKPKPSFKKIDAELAAKVKKGSKKLNLSEDDIKEELNDMSDEETVPKEKPEPIDNFIQPKYFNGDLRNYQKVGLNWLKVLYENGLHGILADEMGLGKTIQVIALFAYLFEKQIPGPYMVIVPLSTLPNWTSEFKRFAPQLPVVVYYGNAEQRLALRSKLEKKVRISPTFSSHPIVILTYQGPLNDSNYLRKFHWRYIVIDEAQRIKNFESQLFRIVKSFNSVNRLLLTGTPLQNDLRELWSLLNFLLPDVFNNLEVFESWFDPKQIQGEDNKKKFLQREQEKHVLSTLREILHPFMLRRLKEDVCPEMPPIKEVIVYTPLTAMQFDLYSAILNRDISTLSRKEEVPVIVDVDGKRPKRRCTQRVDLDYYWRNNNGVDNKTSLDENVKIGGVTVRQKDVAEWQNFATMTEENVQYYVRLKMQNTGMMYRHVVNHPYLIHYPLDDCNLGVVDNSLVTSAGKMLVLNAMLKKLKERGHKILFFSNFVMLLDILEDYLYNLTDYKYVRLDGSAKFEDRRESIEKFQTDPEVFLFMLTTKAGAVGLNLAAADTVIIYDSDWNPQNDLQAMARCHRIGQTKPVAVYRLCTKGTVDEEIIRRAQAKRFLEKAVIARESEVTTGMESLTKLKNLLEENTFKVLDPKKDIYTDAELDELLDRSDMVLAKSEETCIKKKSI